MPVSGAKPKPDGQARHRVKPTHEWNDVPDVPYAGGPNLPRREGGWPAATKRWWTVVSAMPHCVLWTDADWQFALDTAEVHRRFSLGESGGTELRIREKLLGVTLDSRRDLRIRYVQAAEGVPVDVGEDGGASVVKLDDYRDL